MKFDDILLQVGEFGPYQKRVYVIVCLACVTSAFQTMLPVFILDIPDYRCKVPTLPNDTFAIQNKYHERVVNLSVPTDEHGAYRSCSLFDVSNNMTYESTNRSQMECNEWVYDRAVFQSTAITEYNMVCGYEAFRSHLNMIGFGGMLTGGVVFGIVADIAGRKLSLIASGVIQLVSGICLGYAPSYIAFAIFRFFTGVAAMSTFMIPFVIAVEFVGASKRTFVGVFIQFFWCAGLAIMILVAYFIRNWKLLQVVMSVPTVFFGLYWWFLPESPRWLLSRGRISEAEVILTRIAKSNGRTLPKDMVKALMLEESESLQIWHMFTTPRLVVRGVVVFYNWLALNIIYYGLSLNVGNLSGNTFVNFLISSAAETAAYILCLFTMEKVGRKVIYCVSMVVGGVSCIATLFPVVYGDESLQWVTVVLAMMGKFGASAAFAVIYVFSSEIFPTVVRQSGIGACSIFEGIGGMAAPYISDLGILLGGQLADALPLIVFGTITVSAGLLALLLPETKGKKLPETVGDAIAFGRKEKKSIIYDPIINRDKDESVDNSEL